MFEELAALAVETHSSLLGRSSSTYRYRAHSSHDWTPLAGVIEHPTTVEFRTTGQSTNRVKSLAIMVPKASFGSAAVVLNGLVEITTGSVATLFSVDRITPDRSTRVELQLVEVTPSQVQSRNRN